MVEAGHHVNSLFARSELFRFWAGRGRNSGRSGCAVAFVSSRLLMPNRLTMIDPTGWSVLGEGTCYGRHGFHS
jgi:hypothetical protein